MINFQSWDVNNITLIVVGLGTLAYVLYAFLNTRSRSRRRDLLKARALRILREDKDLDVTIKLRDEN